MINALTSKEIVTYIIKGFMAAISIFLIETDILDNTVNWSYNETVTVNWP